MVQHEDLDHEADGAFRCRRVTRHRRMARYNVKIVFTPPPDTVSRAREIDATSALS